MSYGYENKSTVHRDLCSLEEGLARGWMTKQQVAASILRLLEGLHHSKDPVYARMGTMCRVGRLAEAINPSQQVASGGQSND